MKVSAIGDACIDLYADGRWYATGNVVDTAVHLAQLGIPTAVVSAVGNDKWGRALVNALNHERVDTSHLRVLPGATALTHMSLDGRDRVHGDYEEGVLADLSFGEDDRRFIADSDLVHSALWGHAEDTLVEARTAGAVISFDFADRVTHPLVHELDGMVDYGFFSFAEPGTEVNEFLQARHRAGMRCAVATFGVHGSLAFDGQFTSCGVVEAEVENTVGAGDSYIAGFLAEILRFGSIEQAMQQGARRAAQVVSVFDPWAPAPPTQSEIDLRGQS